MLSLASRLYKLCRTFGEKPGMIFSMWRHRVCDSRFAIRESLTAGGFKSKQILRLSDSDRLIALLDLAAAPSESFGDEVPQRLSWSATERLGDLATPRVDDPTTSATGRCQIQVR